MNKDLAKRITDLVYEINVLDSCSACRRLKKLLEINNVTMTDYYSYKKNNR